MRTTWKFIMNRTWLAGALVIARLTACNNGNDKTTDNASNDASVKLIVKCQA